MLDLVTAFDFFVAVDPSLIQPTNGLTADQQTLLEYVRSVKHHDLAKFLNDVRHERASMTNMKKFKKAIRFEFQKRKLSRNQGRITNLQHTFNLVC